MKSTLTKLFLVFTICVKCYSQDTIVSESQLKTLPTVSLSDSSFPVIYDGTYYNLPDTLQIKGKIVQVSLVTASCGVFCFYGTIKVQLLSAVEGYKNGFFYLTVMCLTGKNENYIDKIVDVKVTKITKGDLKNCGVLFNTINSNGIPFYNLVGGKTKLLSTVVH